jgi:hypothetical protein
MERKETIIEGPLAIGDTRILVVGNLWLGNISVQDRHAFFGIKKPTHIMVISDSETKAFTVEGEGISPGKLIEDVPELSDYL